MKRILVPCDFSKQAVHAFRFALELRQQSEGEIHVVHVIDLPVMQDTLLMPVLSFEEALLKEMQKKVAAQFARLINKYAAEVKRIKTEMLFGPMSFAIEQYIRQQKIDLVVMGTHGVSGAKELLIGSNTEKIVRRSPAPVLSIKKMVRYKQIRNIVFPNTLQQDQEDLTMKVKEIQNFFKARLHVVYINTPSHFTRDVTTRRKLESFSKRFMLKDFTLNIFNDQFEESGVINFTHSIKGDMIVMGTHGRKGINHILSGSVAEDIVNHVDCPIWTYTMKEA